MQKIRNWFEDDAANSGEHYDFLEYDGHLEVRTETAIFMVVEPHSGTNYKWMLRISTMRAFDRWANSTPIELFFDSDVKLCNYLHDNQLNIYKRLLKYLSEEYDDILELPIFSIFIDEVLSFKSSPTYDASEVKSLLEPLKSASLHRVTL